MVNATTIATTPLLIIGAALPRTGTTSIRAALEMLGYRVWHATSMTGEMHALWNELVVADDVGNKELRDDLVDKFVMRLSTEGFNATLDQPSCFVYEDLMKYYPEAKVLNTQRSPESWARSMVEMAYSIDLLVWKPPFNSSPSTVTNPYGKWSKDQLGIGQDEVYLNGVPFNGSNQLETKSSVTLATCERVYKDYQKRVKETVPPEKLITYSAKEGWEPLCQHFLPSGQTCPDEEFPQINTNEKGFLLEWRQRAMIRTKLYKIHPWLSNQASVYNSVLWLFQRQKFVFAVLIVALTAYVTTFL